MLTSPDTGTKNAAIKESYFLQFFGLVIDSTVYMATDYGLALRAFKSVFQGLA